MRYFGEKLDAPVYEGIDSVATPVGEECWWCETAILEGDNGFVIPGSDPTWLPMHRACLLRSVLGPNAEGLFE